MPSGSLSTGEGGGRGKKVTSGLQPRTYSPSSKSSCTVIMRFSFVR